MAGEVGIEPTNAGIKIRCLTTWRLPKGKPLRQAYSHNGWRASERATNPVMPLGICESARCAASSAANAAKMHAPDPVIRAPDPIDSRASASRQREISGKRAAATEYRSLRPYHSEKTAIFADSLLRVNSGAEKIALVDTSIGGVITANHVVGNVVA